MKDKRNRTFFEITFILQSNWKGKLSLESQRHFQSSVKIRSWGGGREGEREREKEKDGMEWKEREEVEEKRDSEEEN